MPNFRYERESFSQVVKNSKSIAEVIKSIGLSVAGGAYHTVKQYIKEYDLDTSHFSGQGWCRGHNRYTHQSIARALQKITKHTPEKSLIDGILLSSCTIHRLLEVIGRPRVCVECGTGEIWNGKPISLHADHINGNKFDNRPKNLQLVCPNCHSQTDTYGSKNRRYDSEVKLVELIEVSKREQEQAKREQRPPRAARTSRKDQKCALCDGPSPRGRFCSYECSDIAARKCPLSAEEIRDRLDANGGNYCKTARELGISDNGIRKRLKSLAAQGEHQ